MYSNRSFNMQRWPLPPGLRDGLALDGGCKPEAESVMRLRELVRQHVDRRPGFLVLTGLDELNEKQQGDACLRLSQLIGTVVPQDASGTILRKVRDKGTRIGEGRATRYADSRYGGSLHSDGAECPFPVPDYFALLCVRQAATGGSLRLAHVDRIMHRLQYQPDVVATLRQPFHFDRRNEERAGELPTVKKPILFDDGPAIGVTYLRDYVELGHQWNGVPNLSKEQRAALDALDALLADPEILTEEKLRPGEFALFDNKRLLHGRTTFEDAVDPAYRRLLYRTWIQRLVDPCAE
jgi:alpha-ketoglutarate-dependent taurine dioxygenase